MARLKKIVVRNGERVSACFAIASLVATLRHQLWTRRADKGDGFAFVPPVNAEICVIYCDDAVTGVKLAHADEAKIG